MKKFILKTALVAAFAMIAGFNVYNSQKEELVLSDLMMENVEALASYEVEFPWLCRHTSSYLCVIDDGFYVYGDRIW